MKFQGLPVVADPYYNPYTIECLKRGNINPKSVDPNSIEAIHPRDMALQSHLLEIPDPLNKERLIKVELGFPPRWKRFAHLQKKKEEPIILKSFTRKNLKDSSKGT